MVRRAGYHKHNRKDYNFWKSTDNKHAVQMPSFSEWKFCEDFNIICDSQVDRSTLSII